MAAKALDIDKYLGKTKNRIFKVGVELEGAWSALDPGVTLDNDSSVKVLGAAEIAAGWKQGELVSEPLEPIQVAPWMRKWYPNKINGTCGLHVHQSFRLAVHYGLLTSEEFQPTVIEYFKRWADQERLPASHPLWPRLRGESEYCQHKWWPGLQMQPTRKDYDHFRTGCRYTVINYCYNRNKTMECRLLPMFEDKDQAIRAVRYYISVTNASLLALKQRDDGGTFEVKAGSPYVDHSLERF